MFMNSIIHNLQVTSILPLSLFSSSGVYWIGPLTLADHYSSWHSYITKSIYYITKKEYPINTGIYYVHELKYSILLRC